jgi:hypothetical protein
MAPSTKATRSPVGKKQSKISTFGRIIKTAPAATSQKAYLAKVTPTVRVTESTDSCIGTGKKRRYDAIDEGESCNAEEQVKEPILKKVRIIAFESASAATSDIF